MKTHLSFFPFLVRVVVAPVRFAEVDPKGFSPPGALVANILLCRTCNLDNNIIWAYQSQEFWSLVSHCDASMSSGFFVTLRKYSSSLQPLSE